MEYFIVNYSETKRDLDFRVDAEYWHPSFVKNSSLVSTAKKIGDFIDSNIVNIKSSPINRDFEYLEISNIFSLGYRTKHVREKEEPDRAHSILMKRDVAVSTVRPNRNAVAFITEDGIIGSSGLSILRAHGIEAEYLYAFCKTSYFTNCLVRATKATMYPAVSNSHVVNTPILIPTAIFRKRVKKNIDKFLSLRFLAEQEYQQAQILFLSELGLTNWHPEHQMTFVKDFSDTQQTERIDAEYYQPKYDEIIKAVKNCPSGWDTLGSLCSVKKSVEVGSEEYLEEGIPFIRVSNLSPFEITEEKYISEALYEELTPKEGDIPFEKSKNHQPNQGEILLSKDGTPSIAYYLKEVPQKMIPSGGILRLRNKTDKVNNEYLSLILNSITTKEQANRDVGGSIILHWKPDQVKETLVPILPEEKQVEIQRKVSESFNFCRKSRHLLESSKRAIEIAIEQGEQSAIDWLEEQTQDIEITH